MTDQDRTQGDRFAAGTGEPTAAGEVDPAQIKPGVERGGATTLPAVGAASEESRAEGTIGAVGEMDFEGAPAGTSGASGASGADASAETQGGASGAGMGSATTGGMGPGTNPDDPAPPQSAAGTLAHLGDSEQSTPSQ